MDSNVPPISSAPSAAVSQPGAEQAKPQADTSAATASTAAASSTFASKPAPKVSAWSRAFKKVTAATAADKDDSDDQVVVHSFRDAQRNASLFNPNTITRFRTSNEPMVVRLALIGPRKAGKTSLCKRFLQNKFSPAYQPSQQVELSTKTFISPHTVHTELWDVPGSGLRLLDLYVKDMQVVIFVADLTNGNVRADCLKWKQRLEQCRKYKNQWVIMMFACKSDHPEKLLNDSQVLALGAELGAQQGNIFLVSAATDYNIQTAFMAAVKTGEVQCGIQLEELNDSKHSSNNGNNASSRNTTNSDRPNSNR